MYSIMKLLFKIIFVLFSSISCYTQVENFTKSEQILLAFAEDKAGYNEKIQINVSGIKLRDFILAIALEHNLNVSVEKKLDQIIINNFYDAVVIDVFIFLIREYQLDFEITGSILSIKKSVEKEKVKVNFPPKEIDVDYKVENDFLSLNLSLDTLSDVVKVITKASSKNVILDPNVKSNLVSVYIENRPFEQVLEMLALSNDLELEKKEDFYYLKQPLIEQITNERKTNRSRTKSTSLTNELIGEKIEINALDPERIDIEADGASISDIIEIASQKLGKHYFMYDKLEGNSTLKVEGVNFEELLSHIFNGTDYTFKKTDNYFIIGKRSTEGLRATELIRLENRTIETVIDLLPSNLVDGIEVKEFIELNGIVVSGSYLKIEELKMFIKSVDQIVPMVQIDIMIVFSEKSSGLTKEMKAGIANEPTQTSGQIFPGLDLKMGAETVNSLINAFNGFGIVNIGAVTPNFYATLRFLESNSVIDITSTPKISTLNGHEATFSVGESSYYLEERVNVESSIGGPVQVSNRVWKKTDANLDITVKPFVSADEFVTLEISVSQNDFQGRVDPTAPPNQTTQSFISLIRVKNGEMILMGGLEKDSKSNSGSGTPFLSRIPGLKWLFSDRSKEKSKSKLHIFIKPTVTY